MRAVRPKLGRPTWRHRPRGGQRRSSGVLGPGRRQASSHGGRCRAGRAGRRRGRACPQRAPRFADQAERLEQRPRTAEGRIESSPSARVVLAADGKVHEPARGADVPSSASSVRRLTAPRSRAARGRPTLSSRRTPCCGSRVAEREDALLERSTRGGGGGGQGAVAGRATRWWSGGLGRAVVGARKHRRRDGEAQASRARTRLLRTSDGGARSSRAARASSSSRTHTAAACCSRRSLSALREERRAKRRFTRLALRPSSATSPPNP